MPAELRVSALARRRVALAVSMALLGATSARAAEEELQEFVITGTRIQSPNATSTSPVQVITAEDIKTGGQTDMTDVLNLLPQVQTNYLGQGLGNRSSGLSSAGGVANVDLRGLGPNRTLVLVNGRRLGVGSPNTAISSPAPDVDQIPSALVERVDVVTGGASATYGSDAIGGVVNFITKKNFTGLQIDYDIGWNWHDNHNNVAQGLMTDGGYTPLKGSTNDGKSTTASVTMGTDFADGNGNVTAFIGYMTVDPVRSSDRDFGGCQLFANTALTGADCGGSANSNYVATPDGTEYMVSGNRLVPWGSVDAVPPAVYNSQSLIYMNRDNTRYNAGFLAHMDVTPEFKPYSEFMFMNDRSRQEIAPSALFIGANPLTDTGGYLVNCSNPLLSAQQRAIICTPAQVAADAAAAGKDSANYADLQMGRRNVEGGGRSSYYEHTNYRAVVGAAGTLFDAWTYDAYGQYYYTNFFTANGNYLNFDSIAKALLVTGTAANPVCVSGGSCVPYNIWTEGGVTSSALAYLYTPGTASGNTSLKTVHADITGQLGQYGIKLPTADEGVGINVGYEHRSEHQEYAPDSAELSGLLAGAGGASVALDNGASVEEYFGEVRVPIVQNRPGIHDLIFDGGYRRSDYSVSGPVSTYKLELQYAPTEQYRIRGGYQRAIRAPSLIELYTPGHIGQIAIGTDPCARTRDDDGNIVAAAATLAQCARSGVTAAQYGNGGATNTIPQAVASQLSQLQSGNLNLKPETATSYNIGVNFTPEFAPGLSGSIDYFHIKVKDEINTYDANVVVNSCVFQGDPFYCSLLHRLPSTGGLNGATTAGGYIDQTNYNVSAATVEGIDLQAVYKLPLASFGTLQFMLNGSYSLEDSTTPQAGSATYDCIGLFGPVCQTVNPKWRHNLRATWVTPWQVNLALTWRYLGPVKLDNNDSDPSLFGTTFGAVDKFNASIAAYNWFDLSATWNFTDKMTLRGGINNVLDKDPPLITSELISGGGANTYEIYDIFGRQIFASVAIKF